MAETKEDVSIDHNLYSRQLGVFGTTTMSKLMQMDVLIVGLKGLGVETAKNLILAGPRSVSLFDPDIVAAADLGRNFYLTEKDIGSPRAAACCAKLQELNPYVKVKTVGGSSLTETVVKHHAVVVFTCQPMSQLLKWNAFCRKQQPAICFIAADVRGVAGFAFSDFGPQFTVFDRNGEGTRTTSVLGALNSNPLVVFTDRTKAHGLSDGDTIMFNNIGGMEELNDGVPRVIKNVTPYTFEVDEDATQYTPFTVGGTVTDVKVPVTCSFVSLEDQLFNPVPPYAQNVYSMITPDMGDMGKTLQLHIAFLALDAFHRAHGRYPRVRDETEAKEVLRLAQEQNSRLASGVKQESLNDDLIRTVAMLSSLEFSPLCTIFGGILAQEVVKATGKFTPLGEFLYLDAVGSLTLEAQHVSSASPSDALEQFSFTRNGRLHDLKCILGYAALQRLKELKLFLVGSGALGCEFLKDFAMLHLCSEGLLTVTDMDTIEVSNLNRQFLFRSSDVGRSKSVSAARSVLAMNPSLKVQALETAVGPDTEHLFDPKFWRSQDVIINALDNVTARTYVDKQAVHYRKPLLESGTLGTKANVQVIVPGLTRSYADYRDVEEESIPMCTIRNFPSLIEHCIEWSREMFQTAFTEAVNDGAAFLDDPDAWIQEVKESGGHYGVKLLRALEVVEAASDSTWERCIFEAMKQFHEWFYLVPLKLLDMFPLDFVDDKGNRFWSGSKRPPAPEKLDLSNPQHMEFVLMAALLRADTFDVTAPSDYRRSVEESAPTLLPKLPPHKPVPRSTAVDENSLNGDVIHGDEDDAEAEENLRSIAADIEGLRARVRLRPLSFEKDDDANHHIDFITAAANMRGQVYGIPSATRHKVKMIAGKIIPAVATTTATVTGFVCLEMLKVLNQRKLDDYRDLNINLAINSYQQWVPQEVQKVKDAAGNEWSKWDTIDVDGSTTIAEFLERMKEEYGAATDGITYGNEYVYSSFAFKDIMSKRLEKSFAEVLKEVAGDENLPSLVELVVAAESIATGDDLALPNAICDLSK